MDELLAWIQDKSINCSIDGNIIDVVNFGKLFFVKEKEGKIIDDDFSFLLNEEEYDVISSESVGFILFKWGSGFYYSKKELKKNEYNEEVFVPEFKDFSNIGIKIHSLDLDFVHLGIHTGYELLNGCAEPDSWMTKALFLEHKVLGISDKNTLAATLPFQISCKKKGIKSILGETISIAYDYNVEDEHHSLFDLKLFVKNDKGWKNLLNIGKHINVINDKFITEEKFLELTEGLICVISTDSYFNHNIFNKKSRINLELYKSAFGEDLYYQIDSCELDDDEADLNSLKILDRYFKKFSTEIKPVLINDSYYINKEDYKIKGMLNKVDKKTNLSSSDQFYKSIEETVESLLPLFKSSPEKFDKILDSINNTVNISNSCNFNIDTGNHKLPKFEHENPIELYHELIAKGFQKKVIDKFDDEKLIDSYFLRLEEENDVIVGAGFVDYFLILWDIIEWSKKNDILVGPGRGSAGGSLVAYLLGIIEIDPIEYNLLFERFLNKTRVSGERAKSADSLPDIDVDFEGLRRGDVKRYIEEKYTPDNVCSIGTYGRMKIKSALKDFGRVNGVSFQDINMATKMIPDVVGKNYWGDLFKNSNEKPTLKKFVQNNPELCELVKISLGQPKTSSIHASAVLIVPKIDKDGNKMTVFDWMPVKKMDGQLVSEWEGKYIDAAGFLKADILGIAQLDKFHNILELIRKNKGKKVNLNKIKINLDSVMDYFRKGWNEDVFQFGTSGLKTYSKRVKPDGIEDLVAMNALFRPGPMDSNAHIDFSEIKHGKKKAKFDYMLNEVTKNTFGLYVYQEQIMQAVNVLGKLSLSEADELRTAIKKFDKDKMKSMNEKFIKGSLENGCPEKEAHEIWEKLNAFSSYGFNKSHSAAYSLMGYWCQYLKVKYPLEFWTASLNFASYEEEVPNRISEMRKIGSNIKIKPPCINKSDSIFVGEPETNNIYWSLNKIKNVGIVATSVILEERRKNGAFFDLEDFMSRVPKSKVNKRVVKSLIISGAFDNIGGEHGLAIEGENCRFDLLQKHCDMIKSEPHVEMLNDNKHTNWYWVTEQKNLTGFGDINFIPLLLKKEKTIKIKDFTKNYIMSEEFDNKSYSKLKGELDVTIVGRIMFVKHLKYKESKKEYARISIESNNIVMILTLWHDSYNRLIEKVEKIEKSKSLVAVNCKLRYQETYGKSLSSIDERNCRKGDAKTDFIVLN